MTRATNCKKSYRPSRRERRALKLSSASIADAISTLRNSGWLSRTPVDFQDALLSCCAWQNVAAGTSLTHGGDRVGGMYGIASGAVDITPAFGPADLPLIHIVRAPWWFGILPVVMNAPRAVGITTRTGCLVGIVPQSSLNALLGRRPEWWQLLANQALEHFQTASYAASDLLIPDSRRRCIAVLLRAAGHRGNNTRSDDAGISQNELAAMANMSRQTTGAILRDLAGKGLIDLGYRNITLRDPEALLAMLDD